MSTEKLELIIHNVEMGLRDLTPVWKDIRDIYIAFLKEQFRSEGGYAGVKWQPLSENYAKWKAKKFPGKGILRGESDALFNSLTQQSNPQQVFRSMPQWMEWGTSVFYARIHQTGSISVANRPPKRVVLPHPTQAEGERIVDALAAYLFKRARRKS